MKKIPSLFVREFKNHKVVSCTEEVTEGCEWVINGEGFPTEKFDGTACLIKDGKLYKRYDAKKGKKPPKGAIPCQDPDPVTGHWPHWVLVDGRKSEDKWFYEAFNNIDINDYEEGTYELCGPHFQNNPHYLDKDTFIKHGSIRLEDMVRTYEDIKRFLENNYIEGIVFWKDNEGTEMCKIKRSDFGLSWNNYKSKDKE